VIHILSPAGLMARVLLGGALLFTLVLGGCGLGKTETGQLTYELTAQITVGGQTRTGTAVQAVEVFGFVERIPTQDQMPTKLYGEAIDISTPDGTVVFVLLQLQSSGGDNAEALLGACGITDRFATGGENAIAIREFEGTCEVDPTSGARPLVIEVMDPSKGSTMREVNTGSDGIKLVRLSMTKTKAPLSITLPNTYPWLQPSNRRFTVSRPSGQAFDLFISDFILRPKE
jgi:hypothetical protein